MKNDDLPEVRTGVRVFAVPAMDDAAIERVRQAEKLILSVPQTPVGTVHGLHADAYTRTVCVPAGDVGTGAHIITDTQLLIYGDAEVYIGDEFVRVTGFALAAAKAGRKQLIVALTDTYVTTLFGSQASTVMEAEDELTDEAHLLASRRADARNILITGD